MENEITQIDQTGFLQTIEKLSATPNINIDIIQKLIEMQEHVLDRNAKQAFSAAMVRAQSQIKTVVKNQDNQQTRSKYADLEAVCKMATPIYTKEGLALSFYEGDSGTTETVRTCVDIYHQDGHTETRFIDLSVDDKGIQGAKNKTSIHGKGSTFSYGRRYLTCMLFNIPTGDDDDGNGSGGEKVTEEQAANIEALIKEVGADEAKFLKYIKADSVQSIRADMYEKVIKLIEQKRK